jgi:pyruvate,water dikinase
MEKNIIWFDQLTNKDVGLVGGKNASLGEMIQTLTKSGMRVPNGFATTASAYRRFMQQNNLQDRISRELKNLDPGDVKKLAQIGKKIRQWILDTPFFSDFERDVIDAYIKLTQAKDLRLHKIKKNITVAIRSSATAEDIPQASFAGQQETYLNINGKKNVLMAMKQVFASLYTNRAIVYRINNKFEHSKVALSAGVQQMVRSDVGASGVAFSLDTESGFTDVVFINANYGLGETVVQGIVNPDEYYVYKPGLLKNNYAVLRKICGEKAIKMVYQRGAKITEVTKKVDVSRNDRKKLVLNDNEIQELAKYVTTIEKHYKRPMDVEWAKDGIDGKIYIVQARPETVKSRVKKTTLIHYELKEKGKVIVTGRSIGQMIGQGKAKVLHSIHDASRFNVGDVLVADMTDPDWEPIMKKSSAIVTNRGGRTCHAAIVARELGIPAVVGCGNATEIIKSGQNVTVSCAEGEAGFIYNGLLKFARMEQSIDKMPKLPVKIMLNIANPDQAFDQSFIPNFGVGLARLEFIINDMIGIHPNAALNFAKLPEKIKKQIREKTVGYKNPVDFYVDKLREGVATIAAAFYPKPVIVRASDFKTNEYANLIGGKLYEPLEENPMIGFRGASRYVHPSFEKCFALECKALKEVRDKMGLTNVEVMIPFTRTVAELQNVLKVLAKYGLKRGENGLRIIMMCEIPSNVILAEEFLKYVDGFSIGSNDLTQLTLGLDRDSAIVANLFDERNAAVKSLLKQAIQACQKMKKYIGICGQAPSDYPDLAAWLMEQKIESMSLNPDSVLRTWLHIAEK